MLYCNLILLKGEGCGSCKCKTQPHLGTTVRYTLYTLPAGGTLLVGDGSTHYLLADCGDRGEWTLPPLDTQTMWAAYLMGQDLLAVGSADGITHDYQTNALLALLLARSQKDETKHTEPAPSPAKTDASVEGTAKDEAADGKPAEAAVDLATMGVTAVLTSDPEIEEIEEIAEIEEIDEIEEIEEIDDLAALTPEAADPAAATVDAPVEPVHSAPRVDRRVQDILAHLDDYAPYLPLMQAIPGSRWVWVPEGDSGYVLGVLYDSTPVPTHLCYGVKGRPSRPLSADAEWLPAAEDDPAPGYWIIYNQL